MEVRNVGFGAITAGAIKKGMILRNNEHSSVPSHIGLEREILSTKTSRKKGVALNSEIVYKWTDQKYSAKQYVSADTVFKDLDLVGWVKKVVKGKKA